MTIFTRTRLRALATTGVAAVGFSALALVPAQAVGTSVDVSGLRLDFSNTEEILDGGQINDEVRYLNVATVGGVQVDATVTITAMANMINVEDFLYFDEAAALEISNTFSEEYSVGCYSSADYIAWLYNEPNTFDHLLPTDLLSGNDLDVLDDADEDRTDNEIKAITTHIEKCGVYGMDSDAYYTATIAFTTGDAQTPVTLENLTLSANDIDGDQYFRLESPKPTSFRTLDPTELTLDESVDDVTFTGESISDDEMDQLLWSAEATYDSVSSLQYTFGSPGGGGSSLTIDFTGIDWDGNGIPDSEEANLASTGVDATMALVAGAAFFAAAAGVAVVRRRVRS